MLTRQVVTIVAAGTRIQLFIEGDALGHHDVEEGEAGNVGFYASDGRLTVGLLSFHVSGRELN